MKTVIYIKHHGNEKANKQWTKKIDKVNLEKSNGYAFEGFFLKEGENRLNEGDVLLFVGGTRGGLQGIVKKVEGGELQEVKELDYPQQIETIKEVINQQLGMEPPNPFKDCTDEQISSYYSHIMEEIKKREIQ